MLLITGGLGFIGGNLISHILEEHDDEIINIDSCTYASNQNFQKKFLQNSKYKFLKIDIFNQSSVKEVFKNYNPSAIIHLAAESHVDNSIKEPLKFLNTNIIGTFNLLEESRKYVERCGLNNFRFIHVSTDEVFGSLGKKEKPFSEKNKYLPNSPYSASKASSDHLVRAYYKTYGLNCIITNCSNNYGPFQHTEKLIPKVITNALKGLPIPIYGNGDQIRDWLYVKDHCTALMQALCKGIPGETYNIGGNNEIKNLTTVEKICEVLSELKPANNCSYFDLIEFVKDRPGHDNRYAIDSRKAKNELKWQPAETFESGIHKTVSWYLQNQ